MRQSEDSAGSVGRLGRTLDTKANRNDANACSPLEEYERAKIGILCDQNAVLVVCERQDVCIRRMRPKQARRYNIDAGRLKCAHQRAMHRVIGTESHLFSGDSRRSSG